MAAFLISWAQGIDTKEYRRRTVDQQPVAYTVLSEFRKSADTLVETLLTAIPSQVQSVLGKPDLQPLDLLQLPLVPAEVPLWGVYVDLSTSNSQTQFLIDARGVYVGSSSNKKGMSARIQEHVRTSQRNLETLKSYQLSAHYKTICRPEVNPCFRALALTSIGGSNDETAVIVEGLLSAYLNSVVGSMCEYASPIVMNSSAPFDKALKMSLTDSRTSSIWD